jgi:hypothetical protein
MFGAAAAAAGFLSISSFTLDGPASRVSDGSGTLWDKILVGKDWVKDRWQEPVPTVPAPPPVAPAPVEPAPAGELPSPIQNAEVGP